MPPTRVLVVDDDAQMRAMLVMLAELRGIAVDTVGNAEDALSHLEAEAYYAMITDVRLKGRDGLSLAAEARARWPNLRLVLMTGDANPDGVMDRAAILGAHFLEKPFRAEALYIAIGPAVL